ncbi:MAG: hypothetical protein EOP11_04650 [Proteobacteria bacterium]|nr:MAG: hypothetical protein EOP11_04650 [Pseudomonadota bacterium]
MKALLLLVAALLPFTASADFRPGRVRTAGKAELQIISATGVFAGVAQANLSAQVTDGERDFTGYSLTLDGKALSFRARGINRRGQCGITQEAFLNEITTGDAQVNLTVKDFTGATCEIVVNHIWQVTVTSVSIQDGSVSTLVLGGNPEYFMMTL